MNLIEGGFPVETRPADDSRHPRRGSPGGPRAACRPNRQTGPPRAAPGCRSARSGRAIRERIVAHLARPRRALALPALRLRRQRRPDRPLRRHARLRARRGVRHLQPPPRADRDGASRAPPGRRDARPRGGGRVRRLGAAARRAAAASAGACSSTRCCMPATAAWSRSSSTP